MEAVLKTLKDAPVANVLLLLGFLLLLAAASGRAIVITARLDPSGRRLSGWAGAVAMLFGAYIGYRISNTTIKGSSQPPHETVVRPTSSDTRPTTLAGSPTPTPVSAPTTVDSPETYVDWNCEEPKTAGLEYQLPVGAHFLTASVQIREVDKAKAYSLSPVTYDEASRTARASATFVGLDKFLFNCAGGGHARIFLRVSYVP